MAEKFGGGMQIDCPQDGGTVVEVWLPVPRPVSDTPQLKVR
jgi:hypothetical protein